MKFSFISLVTVSATLLSACAIEVVPGDSGLIRAEMESNDTKTNVTDEGIFTWSEGDQIWLHTTNGSVVGRLSSGAGTASAQFSYEAYIGEMTGKSVYPYNSEHVLSGNNLSVVLPAEYDLGSNLANTNAAMYGVNMGEAIKFKHLAGVMRFKFKNVPVGTDKFQITLDKKINGVFATDLSADTPIIETEATENASEKTVTLNFDPLTSVSDICLYVPVPVGTYGSLCLDIWAGSESIWSYSNTVTNRINRKSLLLMPSVTMPGSVSGDIDNGADAGGDNEDKFYLEVVRDSDCEQSVSYTGSDVFVEIDTNLPLEDFGTDVPEDAQSWVTFLGVRQNDTDEAVSAIFEIGQNTSTQQRETSIRLKSSTDERLYIDIDLNQSAPYLTLVSDEIEATCDVTFGGGCCEVNLKTNLTDTDFSVVVPEDATWINNVFVDWHLDTCVLIIDVAANNTIYDRSTTIEIKSIFNNDISIKCHIEQEAKPKPDEGGVLPGIENEDWN